MEINVDNFDARMKAVKPRAFFPAPNTLTNQGKTAIDISFDSMDDFSPNAVARKVDSLSRLLDARTQLANLLYIMNGKSETENLIENLKYHALMKELSSTPNRLTS